MARVIYLALLLLVPMHAAAATEPDPQKLLFLLEYIGLDYEAAVADGEIINPFEYDEMVAFSGLLVENFDYLRRAGASRTTRNGLEDLRDQVRRLRPVPEVRDLVGSLVTRLYDELDVVNLPVVPPDPERGRQLYVANCSQCHGPTGGGDGLSSPGMDPPATSFQEARTRLISPHQVHGAITYGIDGTAMPFYGEAFSASESWDVAFHVMTLRDGFDPRQPLEPLPLTLVDLAGYSDEDLLRRLKDDGSDARQEHIDYYRRNVQQLTRPDKLLAQAKSPQPTRTPAAPASASGLQVALGLQGAFADVAERVSPSVVGVTGFVRVDAKAQLPEQPEGFWREGSVEDRLYPGFRREHSASGFLIGDEGHVLTTQQALLTAGGATVDAVNVELLNGTHLLARIVATEPTINLGIVQIESLGRTRPPELAPAAIGDSDLVRVGHWAIAMGDPWGPETTFAVGTLSRGPDRLCYQADVTSTLMQATLRVPRESYGGPVVDIHGRVVGLTVPHPAASASGIDPGARTAEYVLPINLALGIYDALRTKATRKSPWLGFSVLEIAAARRRLEGRPNASFSRTGVYIDNVFEPSPASAAGIEAGDCLQSVDGQRLFSVPDFQKWLYLSGIGRTVTLELYRDGRVFEKQVRIEERP